MVLEVFWDCLSDKFVATSDGSEIKRPRFLKTLQYKLKLASAGRGTSTENNYLLEAQHLSQKSPPSTPASDVAYKLRRKPPRDAPLRKTQTGRINSAAPATETAPWERASCCPVG